MRFGKFEVHDQGPAWDENGIKYELINIVEFDKDDKPMNGGTFKSYYLRCREVGYNIHTTPTDMIRAEADVHELLRHPNNARLELETRLIATKIANFTSAIAKGGVK